MSQTLAAERRVVVTGLGVATSLGCEVDELWQAMVAGGSGIGLISQFESHSFPVRIGGEVELPASAAAAAAQPNRTLRFGVWAADRAFQDSGLSDVDFDPWRAGVCLGAGLYPAMEDRLSDHMFEGDELSTTSHLERCRERPELLTQLDLPAVSATMSGRLGFTGPSLTVQSACASGTQAIGEAFHLIRSGAVDIMLTGGTDSMMSMFCVAGFTRLGALSRHPDPTTASRPFDRTRDGFVLGEGAGLMILESLDRALARDARIYAELVGYGSSADGFRFTDIEPQARGAIRCLEAALASADLKPEDVDYVNAHGTATRQNDRLETLALKSVFGDHARRLAISSNKSQLGHLLCAAGGIEFLLTVLTVARGVLPPTLNLEQPDPECDLDYVPRTSRPAEVSVALSNSFGFGGQNATLVARRWDG